MTIHNVAEAKAHLSQLLEAALKGEDVIVARAGKPLVRLVPVIAPAARDLGFLDLPTPDERFDPLDRRPTWPPGRDGPAAGHARLRVGAHRSRPAVPPRPDRDRDLHQHGPRSAATAWEIAIKHRAGTWPEAELLLAQHDALTRRLGAQPLEINPPTPSALAASTGTTPTPSTGCLPPSRSCIKQPWSPATTRSATSAASPSPGDAAFSRHIGCMTLNVRRCRGWDDTYPIDALLPLSPNPNPLAAGGGPVSPGSCRRTGSNDPGTPRSPCSSGRCGAWR